jgi:hypothetical protein
MKKCHFSILYNELPFLKQKMKFLYDHFEQLIFYDLNVGVNPHHHSTDGSFEYIKDYPDPENKITLIEKTNLDDVIPYSGDSSIQKRKMFTVGSQYVWDDIDSFWCFDLDEFFDTKLFGQVEQIFLDENINSINLEHLVFIKNKNFIYAEPNKITYPMYARIARHKKGRLYGHCTIHKDLPNCYDMTNDENFVFHFAWIGKQRVESKLDHYTNEITGVQRFRPIVKQWREKFWDIFEQHEKQITTELYGYPFMHPTQMLRCGILRYTNEFPDYINIEELMKDLKT